MASINLRSATIEADCITVRTELEKWRPCIEMRLEVVARDGYGHYAVRWDAGDRWMAGEFVENVEGPELYEKTDEDKEFRSEDGDVWRTVKQSDGGFKWVSESESSLNVTTDSEGFQLCDLQMPNEVLEQVFLTEGMVDVAVDRIYGVFDSVWHARQSDADDRCLGIVSGFFLTEKQREIAASNSALL